MTDYNRKLLEWYNKSLMSSDDLALCNLFSEHADLYSQLNMNVKQEVEKRLLTGIRSGKLDYKTGEISGQFSRASTWVADNIELFERKAEMIECARLHALESSLAQNYSFWYFYKYISLDIDENLAYYVDLFGKRRRLSAGVYSFLRLFIPDKTNKLYAMFRDKIDSFSEAHVSQENRIPEKSELPF